MITIVKQPTKLYQERTVQKHFRCRYCGTEWIADPADYVTAKAEVQVNNVEQYNYFANCPICGRHHCFEYFDEGRAWDNVPYVFKKSN